MRTLALLVLTGCGGPAFAVNALELPIGDAGFLVEEAAADGGMSDAPSMLPDVDPLPDVVVMADVLEERPSDPPDVVAAPDVLEERQELDTWAAPDVADEPAPVLCCWVSWNPNGGCCPAPNDPACAYHCGMGGLICTAACSVGGCPGAVQTCP